jgi:hypothetical protein
LPEASASPLTPSELKGRSLRPDGKPLRVRPSGEMASPHTGHRAILGHAVFHRGNDIIGECNLRRGRGQITSWRCLRLASNPGFEQIELMLEIREGLLQISQFFRAGISMHRMLPIRCSRRQAKAPWQPKLHGMGFPILRGDERLDPQAIHCPAVLEHAPDPKWL